VFDGHRRVHQGGFGDRRGRSHSLAPRHRRVVSERGTPTFLRSDNGPEFVSKALLSWIVAQRIGTALIEPGKPWQNGVTESFNGNFRDECLSLEWFRSRAEAKVVIESWLRHYNAVRPHSTLSQSRRPKTVSISQVGL
jgi:putative transposase